MAAPVPEDKGCVHLTKARVAEDTARPKKGLAEITFPEDVGGLILQSLLKLMRASLPSKIQPMLNIFYKLLETERYFPFFLILFLFSFSPRNIQERFFFQLLSHLF